MPKLLFTPVCAQRGGGSTWTHSFLSTFPQEFRYKTCTICVHTQNNHISAKWTIKKCFVSKWRPENKSFHEKSHVTKLWKTTFPKDFFSIKFGLKLKNMNTFTFLYKIWKALLCLKMTAKRSFVTLCNNAHLC